MHITVKLRNIFGYDKVYPICDTAKAFARIAKTTTLTDNTLREIKNIGFDIKLERGSL
jgi:hypothetical protein